MSSTSDARLSVEIMTCDNFVFAINSTVAPKRTNIELVAADLDVKMTIQNTTKKKFNNTENTEIRKNKHGGTADLDVKMAQSSCRRLCSKHIQRCRNAWAAKNT